MLNISRKQWCVPSTECEKANRRILHSCKSSWTESTLCTWTQCPVTCLGQPLLMAVPTCTEAACQFHTYKIFHASTKALEFTILINWEAEAPFLFKNFYLAGQLFRKKGLISELQLNINKTCRELELSRKCSFKAFIMIIIITPVTEETHCAVLLSINVL